MNRKTFLKLLPAIPAGVGSVVKMVDVPTIYGDGVHCDADGVDAFVNGREFRDLTGKLTRIISEEPVITWWDLSLKPSVDLSFGHADLYFAKSCKWTAPWFQPDSKYKTIMRNLRYNYLPGFGRNQDFLA